MRRTVWVYWEGEMPPYINLCIATIRRHHDDVRLLDRSSFDELFLVDRDLNIDALAVNHRSDFVRAYILYHYGGLYVDSDCVVMRPLTPLFEGAEACGFAGYCQSDGYMSCNLMASVPGGDVARDHYERVRERVAAGRPLDWLDLASVPMDLAVRAHPGASYLVPFQQIMPLWWGHNDQLLVRRDDTDHQGHLEASALCYMLSNNTIKSGRFTRSLTYAPKATLLRDRSFLSFLFRRALDLAGVPSPQTPSHLGGHEDVTQLDEGALNYLATRYQLESMIDIGCGPGGMVHYAWRSGIEAVGVDGDPMVARDMPGIIEHDYTTGPLDAGDFDLGWSVEFVEHVDDRYEANFLRTFARCNVLFLTAATPGQPGHHHVNCQPAGYWIDRFRKLGFLLDEEATSVVRQKATMWSGFTQERGMVFVKGRVSMLADSLH